MIVASTKLVSSEWHSVHSSDNGITFTRISLHELCPSVNVGATEQTQDELIVTVLVTINFDGLLYQVEVAGQSLVAARQLDEDLITSALAGAEFGHEGVMRQIQVNGTTYDLSYAKLLGLAST